MANNPFYKLASISVPKSKSKSVKSKPKATPKRKSTPKRKASPMRKASPLRIASPKRKASPMRKAPKRQFTARKGVEPARKKTTKKGKQNPWLKHVNAVLKELKKENPKASLRDAIPIAKESYNKAQSADSWNVSTSKYSTVSMPKKAQTLSLPMRSQGSYDLDAWMTGKNKGKKKGKKKNNSLTDSLIGSLQDGEILA